MAKKRKATAKKSQLPRKPKKSAARRLPKARVKAAKPKRAAAAKPGANSRGARFASFEEAKNAAIDSLIQVIEEAERRLMAVKRAGSSEELGKACRASTKSG